MLLFPKGKVRSVGVSRLLLASLIFAIFSFSAAAASGALSPSPNSIDKPTSEKEDAYQLGTGDKIRITVFGQDDLGGEFVVDDTGAVRLPMIGEVKAEGLSIHDFENAVAAKLAEGYLVNPHVSVEVKNYRPFYIMGEVVRPGEYPCETGMTALNAVSLAGGFTYRADQAEVYIRHKNGTSEEKKPADNSTLVRPGDIVRIAERFF